MHYFEGKYPERLASGSPWPGAKFMQIRTPTEVAPGFWLFTVQSDTPGTREMNEISIAIKTPQGLALMVGCSHPGIEKNSGRGVEDRLTDLYGVRRLPPRGHCGRRSEQHGHPLSGQVEARARRGRPLYGRVRILRIQSHLRAEARPRWRRGRDSASEITPGIVDLMVRTLMLEFTSTPNYTLQPTR